MLGISVGALSTENTHTHTHTHAVISDLMFRLRSFPISVEAMPYVRGVEAAVVSACIHICPCSSSCHTPSFYGTCALFTGSAVPFCEQCLILCSLTTLILVVGCWVQFSDDTAYESTSYGYSCKSLLIFFPSVLLKF